MIHVAVVTIYVLMLLGVSIYAGAEMGNSFPSVMLNIPGTAGGAVTAFDGFPLMKEGKAAWALGICIMASVVGALIGGLASLSLSPQIAAVALRFGPAEICIVILFGLAVIAPALHPARDDHLATHVGSTHRATGAAATQAPHLIEFGTRSRHRAPRGSDFNRKVE